MKINMNSGSWKIQCQHRHLTKQVKKSSQIHSLNVFYCCLLFIGRKKEPYDFNFVAQCTNLAIWQNAAWWHSLPQKGIVVTLIIQRTVKHLGKPFFFCITMKCKLHFRNKRKTTNNIHTIQKQNIRISLACHGNMENGKWRQMFIIIIIIAVKTM